MIAFSSSTFSGSESSEVISATVIISGGVVSSSDITVPITFTEGNATGTCKCVLSEPILCIEEILKGVVYLSTLDVAT